MNKQDSREDWAKKLGSPIDVQQHAASLLALFEAVRAAEELSADELQKLVARHLRDGKRPMLHSKVIEAYRRMVDAGVIPFERQVFDRLRLKPIRTVSGVAPVAVLTEPWPCPGECIFCPEADGYPKSYLPDEPGARRARLANYDPFEQTATRLQSLESMGHATDKIELLILGATWSAYPRDYQEWFVRRCLDVMNGRESATLLQAQRANETAEHRNVGLVIETRPDQITSAEVGRLRWLGVTKVQLGAQSLDDRLLAANRRGHAVADTRRACRLLRLAGFKLHLHWMPNLYQATPASDRADFARLWSDPAVRPDELKLYPCSLIAGTPLYTLWQQGEYQPYSDDELIELLIDCKKTVPPYCRLSRVMRDIPSQYIAAGTTQSHLRQVVQREMKRRGLACRCIRCREVRQEKIAAGQLHFEPYTYSTDATTEHFLSYITSSGKLAGFLRLSLPLPDVPPADIIDELRGSAVIREVHIYGPALEIGAASQGEAQHAGLGAQLIEQAAGLAREAGFRRLAVISAIGTREYYRKQGFELGELYMTRSL